MMMGTRDEDILQDVPEGFDESDVIKKEDWGFEVQAVKDRWVWACMDVVACVCMCMCMCMCKCVCVRVCVCVCGGGGGGGGEAGGGDYNKRNKGQTKTGGSYRGGRPKNG